MCAHLFETCNELLSLAELPNEKFDWLGCQLRVIRHYELKDHSNQLASVLTVKRQVQLTTSNHGKQREKERLVWKARKCYCITPMTYNRSLLYPPIDNGGILWFRGRKWSLLHASTKLASSSGASQALSKALFTFTKGIVVGGGPSAPFQLTFPWSLLRTSPSVRHPPSQCPHLHGPWGSGDTQFKLEVSIPIHTGPETTSPESYLRRHRATNKQWATEKQAKSNSGRLLKQQQTHTHHKAEARMTYAR